MDLQRTLGLDMPISDPAEERKKLHLYINLKLESSGQPICNTPETAEFLATAQDLLRTYREKNRLLADYLCPADRRIQDFLQAYLNEAGITNVPRLPVQSLILDRHGVARELSLPFGKDEFKSAIVSSYRVKQGVLHNPASDRRTTQGSFHIAEGGLPIPGDKKAVPVQAFANMLAQALHPSDELLSLPFTSEQPNPAKMFVSLLLRPVVCPAISEDDAEKSMEIRFFAPGNLVSNLDFVESIFGNGGNPFLAKFDAGLDSEHWTGHTGCVILAPQLTQLSKKSLGLPQWDEASERQRKEGMCWKDESELYNEGQAFKVTCRDRRGVMITILADNYFGYCKKEVKTQISYAANLYGLAEEEHAGGALAFARRNHGEEYGVDSRTRDPNYSFEEVAEKYAGIMHLYKEGYGIDKMYSDIIYVPQDLRIDLHEQTVAWVKDGICQSIRLQPGKIYIQPNGYKIEMEKHPDAPSWRLVGTDAEGTLCHKPCTVSGGGKSEISKSISDAIIYGPMFVDDINIDLDMVQRIFDYDYSNRFKKGFEHEDRDASRKPLSPERSLGSVIKLLTPSSSYTDEYNTWLNAIPPRIMALSLMIKRFYRQHWGNEWRNFLSVDEVDSAPGHELKLGERKIIASYLRVGFNLSHKWRTFKLRQDFVAAEKIQMEDDITASVVVPYHRTSTCRPVNDEKRLSVKLVKNCEYRLFQRPDDAIIPGYDEQAEYDIAQPGNFLANYEPLKGENLANITDDVMTLYNFTPPMKDLLSQAAKDGDTYVVSSAHPRLVDGKPSKNPRYLQTRPDLLKPIRKYVAEIGARLHRKLPISQNLCIPVDSVLSGRRNNPPEPGIRPLAVYNPIHYQELPELFMDFICSLTGKSPSTTGAGSEGALTKGPFNALRPTADLNNALLSFILTGYDGYSSSAGYIGPNVRVDHDVSMLIPEIWARLHHTQRDAKTLIQHGYLERVEDFDHNGEKVLASRLGYRITDRFVHGFMGKLFDNPNMVFSKEILRPELQDLDVFVDGVNNIVEAQRKVAQQYIDDGSIEDACPPLKALLYIMANGDHHGKDAHHPEIRALFGRDAVISSDWYKRRLEIKQQRDIALWERHIASLQKFLNQPGWEDEAERLDIPGRLAKARKKLAEVENEEYLESLVGTLGADPLGVA